MAIERDRLRGEVEADALRQEGLDGGVPGDGVGAQNGEPGVARQRLVAALGTGWRLGHGVLRGVS